MSGERTPVLYLAPWVDFGGSDKGTIDWFRWLDRSRFAPSLITTQRSENRRLAEVSPFAEEVWPLPELFTGDRFPRFIVEFVVSRGIRLVHIMHSRLGYDLLPDLWALERPPRVVVQLHVEEWTRKSYVRYAAARYGNLVHAFSVSSRHLADAVSGYGVSPDRIEVIPTGVDAEHEFCPQRTSARPGLDGDTVHILFAGRLVEQKDPLLMAEVARVLADRGLAFTIHVLGGGPLETPLRRRVAELGLERRIRFEGQTADVAPWYAAADLVLMTSSFEGVPYVLYEALAMGVAVVAPALPGNVELMGGRGGSLVADRGRPVAYAEALEPLIADRGLRERIGAEGRTRILDGYSARDMGDGHGRLYDRLLAGDASAPARSGAVQPQVPVIEPPSPAGPFIDRPSHGTPLVSVLTPCFNDGRWLRECIAAVRGQTYPAIEMIVVDDASSERETLDYLEELDRSDDVRLIRLTTNRGPSAARNAAVAHCGGRYVLPVDADNVLLPDAVQRFVSQLQGAGERVGFIYPVLQHFGHREDHFAPPAFNPWLLRRDNYIETSSLIDRDVFDRGLRYAEEVVLGAEDWDFVLTMAERGIRGEPAGRTTMRYRNRGFSRSYLGISTQPDSVEAIRRRHPAIDVGIKARWAPALSVIALAPVSRGGAEWAALSRALDCQRFADFELVAAVDGGPGEPDGSGPPIRALPRRLQSAPAQALAHALERTTAPYVAVTAGTGAELLGDPGSLERLTRLLEHGPGAGVIACADGGPGARFPWCRLAGDDPSAALHSLAVSRHRVLPDGWPAGLDESDPVGDLARWFALRRTMIEWRHLAAGPAARPRPAGRRSTPPIPAPRGRAEASERELRAAAEIVLPGGEVRMARWETLPTWAPPFTRALIRHRRAGHDEWLITSGELPETGFAPEHYLGLLHEGALPGTARIVTDPDLGFCAVGRGRRADESRRTLGYAEQVLLPELEPLLLCRHATSGAPVLVCGEDDPLRPALQWPEIALLGWIERWPINPRRLPPPAETTAWLRGLIRTIDHTARRHRVGIGTTPPGDGAWELGALLDRDPGGGVPAWVDGEGRVHTATYTPTRHPFSARRAIRWAVAPAGWHGWGRRGPRARAVARRSFDAVRHTVARRAQPSGAGVAPPAPPLAGGLASRPQGWLMSEDGPDRIAIYSALHPVTSDQLLTRDPSEARELGYESLRMLGFALAVAPQRGTLARPRVGIPWGSRFGEALTRAEDPLAGHV